MRRTLGVVCLIVLGARFTAAHDPIAAKVTFTPEIQAILRTRCTPCHTRGGSAPMPLRTYAEVRPWARAIKDQVLGRGMPKWHAARGYGAFLNDPTLTPLEIALVAAWVDSGLAQGAARPPTPSPPRARKTGTAVVVIPPRAITASSPAANRRRTTASRPEQMVGGWSFEPGDPLITSAIITSDTGIVGTWVAGDGDVKLPASMAVRVRGRIRIEIQRRAPTRYEAKVVPQRSVLRFTTAGARSRRVWTEMVNCGSPRTSRPADILAVRPILAGGASVKVWLERAGAPKAVLGWFREFEPAYPRTYWLARPTELPVEARLQGDGPCRLALTLVSPR
ncbi:MAG: hypothetical protein ABIQ52_00445 [Vicinamibacterales bacterium]